jgi:hypothetical protein
MASSAKKHVLAALFVLAAVAASAPRPALAQGMYRWPNSGPSVTVPLQAPPSLTTVAALFQLEMAPACVADGAKWVVVGARADAPGVASPGVDRVVFCYNSRDFQCKNARYCCARYGTKRECEAALPSARDRRIGNWEAQLTCGQRMCLFTGRSGFEAGGNVTWCERAWSLYYGGRPPACTCQDKAPRGPAPICVRDPARWV